jgi:hypothetical protein
MSLAFCAAPIDNNNNNYNESNENNDINNNINKANKRSKNITYKNKNAVKINNKIINDLLENDDDSSDNTFDDDNNEITGNLGKFQSINNKETINNKPVQNVPIQNVPIQNVPIQNVPIQNGQQNLYNSNIPNQNEYATLNAAYDYNPEYQNYTQDSYQSISNTELLKKLNNILYLLEEHHEEKKGYITEELILYIFLGVFIIYVLDSFIRIGKYVR